MSDALPDVEFLVDDTDPDEVAYWLHENRRGLEVLAGRDDPGPWADVPWHEQRQQVAAAQVILDGVKPDHHKPLMGMARKLGAVEFAEVDLMSDTISAVVLDRLRVPDELRAEAEQARSDEAAGVPVEELGH